MKIFGIGTDIVNVQRMKKSLSKNGSNFKNKIFSKNEIIYCEKRKNSHTFFAKRFAAKEAFVKALGSGFRNGINFSDISVKKNNLGKPKLVLSNSIKLIIKKKFKLKKFKIFLSLSDEKKHSIAFVVIEKK